jgi:hypothetical protein
MTVTKSSDLGDARLFNVEHLTYMYTQLGLIGLLHCTNQLSIRLLKRRNNTRIYSSTKGRRNVYHSFQPDFLKKKYHLKSMLRELTLDSADWAHCLQMQQKNQHLAHPVHRMKENN